jgi:hypothetical protein
MKIQIDRDMLLTELYELRALIAEISLNHEEAKDCRAKIDSIVNLLMNSPSSESNSANPKPKLRRG